MYQLFLKLIHLYFLLQNEIYSGTYVRKIGADKRHKVTSPETVRVPANLVEHPVDITAAGDLWAAGFLFGLLRGRSLEKCAQYGARLSGEVVKVVGSQLPEEVWTQIKQELSD